MLKEKLKNHKIILGSGSPRRQEYFRQLGLDFKIVLKNVEEVYPKQLKAQEITEFLAELKGKAFLKTIGPNEIVITSDTIVWHEGDALGKPKDQQEAFSMLNALSGKWHEVITSVCFSSTAGQNTGSCSTKVKIKVLADSETAYYVENFKPFDKAGGYGIQEWIGLIAIEEIKGSYSNVVGLPTHLVYKMFADIIG